MPKILHHIRYGHSPIWKHSSIPYFWRCAVCGRTYWQEP